MGANSQAVSPAVLVALGAQLRLFREQRALTVKDVARAMKFHVSAVYNVERGVHALSFTNLVRLGDVLDFDVVLQPRKR